MRARGLGLVGLGLVLVACGPAPASPTADGEPRRQGEPCTLELRCADGLKCVMNGAMERGERGVCMP